MGWGRAWLGINGMCEGLGRIPSTVKNKTQDFQPSEYIVSVSCVKTHASSSAETMLIQRKSFAKVKLTT